METSIWPTLASNAALLLALFIIYELSYLISSKRRVRVFINGVFVSAICLAIMSLPFILSSGVVFDTRSILISVSAMLFGAIPSVALKIKMQRAIQVNVENTKQFLFLRTTDGCGQKDPLNFSCCSHSCCHSPILICLRNFDK